MDSWPLEEAEARFGEMLERCLENGPQVVTRDGAEAAVLVPAKQWAERSASFRAPHAAGQTRPTLRDLLTDHARFDFPDPERRPFIPRPVELDN